MHTPLLDLTGLTREALTSLVVEQLGEKPFRARQLWSWLHVKLAQHLDEMSDLSIDFRRKLSALSTPLRPEVSTHQISRDGTEKWLLRLSDGQQIETVYIPEDERGTLCISSQVGCTLSCPFCHTGAQGFARNLTPSEIVQQVLFARRTLAARDKRVTNIVLMGMGEPLYNYEAVRDAVLILLDDSGLAFGTRKVTLSTAGLLPKMEQAGRELGVNLAISLHAVRDTLRDELVPLNKKYNLQALRAATLRYPLKSGRRVTWEYVMLHGVNDSEDDARLFVSFLKDIPSKINLIPFNPWPGVPYQSSSMTRIAAFQKILYQAGFVTVIRDRRGEDIDAACGQLKGAVQGARPRPPGAS
ncbi:23S rRNA m(2)A-2503 methyltransferase [Magnetococcus marinus MC-1]|uniref:Dual-specificity RNA methyltransferase RlmN n=1 Tax=Magnetococcus marinus (strain ATCC BAA-1437 / JCM 17883 / MC-1) TaxID=156889 RepID=RLMN_MAGMM|nr:23S rRNA (adenine(2503)-C(2))-methyltransferase RlmN [Magnetococcus marinus]A0LBZ1.1 RecName: Full=Dual-specificity RNA methyltransferase RlmN; AltName: Full=23S rRNA (adenine(2503)-C(2))-methyltransferase; AltName: Full=23S rRNA m2A2503 methyltransferase; AltName: Full=Ribosomal RNA large subunit methyltransferase N; AltName: Full=tRNA (adenine(37)-C(2))-methyltransferase; AltName: Full=tRNA m2A37 methyltransferase [Magnetococcus marinus MC-1]ABK45484.1 23S rRNA m(2)A-2503 methyltransferase [